MRLHGDFGDSEFAADLLVRQSDEAHHLAFTWCEQDVALAERFDL
jgi:hypothetical protein